jgi:hypothetical protein
MGFLCYVCGKTDPSEFFYGMRLSFDGPPHLVQLKQAIEARAVQDNALPDGSKYIITDLEILDLRLNMWTPLDSRAQLYSGCHICAIRDSNSATSSGPIDIARKLPQQRALGFALDVESTFRALDVENRGLVSLSNVLHVFRHDLNYAVDFFQLIDVRNCGQVNMQDLMSATAKKTGDFWKELQLRISRGGLDPGISGSSRAGLEYTPNRSLQDRNTIGGASTPRTPMSGGIAGGKTSIPLRASTPGGTNQTPTTKRQGIAAAILASARQQKEKDDASSANNNASNKAGNNDAASVTSGGADGSPKNEDGSKAAASARKVLELFQKASRPGGSSNALGGKGITGAMAKMKELANKNKPPAPSVTGSNSTTNNPLNLGASKRK